MLSSVLVDPNLHTDVRMRIHREISEILRGAVNGRQRAAVGSAPALGQKSQGLELELELRDDVIRIGMNAASTIRPTVTSPR